MPFLDRVQSMATVEALAAAPDDYANELAREIPTASSLAELAARDAALVAGLQAVDDLAARAMRIELDRVLATDTSLAPQTRRLFTSTVVSYRDKLPLLAERVRDAATRGGSREPDALADAVVAAAESTLALRDAVRAGVLGLIRTLATASIPDADARARDRDLDDAQRKQWSRARRDLEAIAEEPARIGAAPMPTRMAAWEDQLDEPAPKPEPTLAELNELD